MTNLRKLDLGNTGVTEEGLVLNETRMNGPGVVYLSKLTNLRVLDLWGADFKGTKVTEAGAEKLKETLPGYGRVWR